MTMEIDALHAGQPMRNSLDPCNTCAEWQQQAERVRVLREALLDLFGVGMERMLMGDGKDDQIEAIAKARAALKATQ